MPNIVQGFCAERSLSTIQRLSIASFLASGHAFHLYSYEAECRGMVDGTILRDANEILPASEVVARNGCSNYAEIGAFFRYRLLLAKGGLWVDSDVMCLRPFDFEEKYVFSAQHDLCRERINSRVIKAPAGSEIIESLCLACQQRSGKHESFSLMEEAVNRHCLRRFVQRALVFSPIMSANWQIMLAPQQRFIFQKRTYGVTLWQELWHRGGWDIDGEFAPGCLYQQFKSDFLFSGVAPSAEYRYEVQ